MVRELSPFELDRELSRVAPRARAAYRAVRNGREVTLTIPEVLRDPETRERVQSANSDPIAPPLMRWLYWLHLAERCLPREGERIRRYRVERHALDTPLSGHFTWRELLGHTLRDAERRPALLQTLLSRGSDLRDASTRVLELRAELPRFGGRERAELELPSPDIAELARDFLVQSRDAFESLGARDLHGLIELGLAPAASDGWPRQLSLRSLDELLGERRWLSGLVLEVGGLPAPLSAASFMRGLLRLGAAWTDALAAPNQPYCIAHDPFGLSRSTHGALLAGLTVQPAFVKRQLGLGKERAASHGRSLSRSALLFARMVAFRVLQDAPALEGPRALREAFTEHAVLAFGFELPPEAAGLWCRPRLGDAQRLAALCLAATRNEQLAQDHDEDWFRNPRAIEQLRAEARIPAPTSASREALAEGAAALRRQLTSHL